MEPGNIEPLRRAVVTLAEVCTALRLYDPDADPDADAEEGHGEEADKNQLVEDLALDRPMLANRYCLASRGMPQELIDIWEKERDHDAPLSEGTQADGAKDQDLLEENVGVFLSLALEVERQVRETGRTDFARVVTLSGHFETAIRPALGDRTVAVRASADRSASNALLVLAFGGALCAIAAIAIAVFLFPPMVSAVVEHHLALVSERDRALASSQAKKDFLAAMSQELRTP